MKELYQLVSKLIIKYFQQEPFSTVDEAIDGISSNMESIINEHGKIILGGDYKEHTEKRCEGCD